MNETISRHRPNTALSKSVLAAIGVGAVAAMGVLAGHSLGEMSVPAALASPPTVTLGTTSTESAAPSSPGHRQRLSTLKPGAGMAFTGGVAGQRRRPTQPKQYQAGVVPAFAVSDTKLACSLLVPTDTCDGLDRNAVVLTGNRRRAT
jgi:hypothetical protein